MCRSLAAEIAEVLSREERRFVIVISTDLSHYPSIPGGPEDRTGSSSKRSGVTDTAELYSTLGADRAQACGEGPVLEGMELGSRWAPPAWKMLKYANWGIRRGQGPGGRLSGGRDCQIGGGPIPAGWRSGPPGYTEPEGSK